jgi:aldehyde dehydrogenase (NAD+)
VASRLLWSLTTQTSRLQSEGTLNSFQLKHTTDLPLRNSQGFLFNSGQVCAAASRLFIQSGIADSFIETLKAHFEGAEDLMGDPSDPSTMLGPLADHAQLKRVLDFIETGKSKATLLVGGKRKGDKGAFVTPTIFLNP